MPGRSKISNSAKEAKSGSVEKVLPNLTAQSDIKTDSESQEVADPPKRASRRSSKRLPADGASPARTTYKRQRSQSSTKNSQLSELESKRKPRVSASGKNKGSPDSAGSIASRDEAEGSRSRNSRGTTRGSSQRSRQSYARKSKASQEEAGPSTSSTATITASPESEKGQATVSNAGSVMVQTIIDKEKPSTENLVRPKIVREQLLEEHILKSNILKGNVLMDRIKDNIKPNLDKQTQMKENLLKNDNVRGQTKVGENLQGEWGSESSGSPTKNSQTDLSPVAETSDQSEGEFAAKKKRTQRSQKKAHSEKSTDSTSGLDNSVVSGLAATTLGRKKRGRKDVPLEDTQAQRRTLHTNRDLMRLAEADSCSMYKTMYEPEPPRTSISSFNLNSMKVEIAKEQAMHVDTAPLDKQEGAPPLDSFAALDAELDQIFRDSTVSEQRPNHSPLDIDFAVEFGIEASPEDTELDARLQAELDSLIPTEEGAAEIPPAAHGTVQPFMPSPRPMTTEADIDARLQAELDSLPMIEADSQPGEESIDDILSSIFSEVQALPPVAGTASVVAAPTPVVADPYPKPGLMAVPIAAPSRAGHSYLNVGRNVAAPVTRAPISRTPISRAPIHQRGGVTHQMPIVTRLKSVQGDDISVSYTTGPDGLVTNVAMLQPPLNRMGQVRKGKELGSFTASQLHMIMQSSQPYLALPMTVTGCPNIAMSEPLRARDTLTGAFLVPEQAVEDEEVDYEEIGVADTFAEYWPSKLKFGMAHPDPVVETATLSSVELPDITYQLSLPAKTTASLSALQLEAVVYACQAHDQILPSGERAGFLLGDGAGVGKGRTIAGIIFDNYLKGRKRALWVSVSNDLKFDAERDFYDIGAMDKIDLVAISKFKYSRIDSDENENFKKGVIFCTYTALIGESLTANSKYKTRLRQLINWLGKRFDGVIVFDECHKAKNLSLMNVGKSTKTGTTVLELQKLLPNARVVYASATGASEPRNMAYMVRLGLWGPGTAYPEFYEFVNAVEKRGIGAMEIVAMDMKLRGTYIARQLSFKDVSFRIEEVPMSKEFRRSYNLAAELWAEINKKFQKACRLMCVENRVQKIITCQFWCAHQRFFKNLCIASKVNHVVKMTRQATRMGKAVVIGLQSTGESRTLEHLERHHGKLNTFVSTSKMIIQSFVEKHFPAPKRDSFHHLLNTGEFEPEARSRPPRPKKAKMNPDWFDDDMDAEAGESDIEMYENSWTSEDERIKAGRKRRGRPPKVDKGEFQSFI